MLLPGPLTTRDDGTLRDATGRRLMLRGANLSGRHKSPPFLAVERPEQLDRWAALGWNLMRLVIPWESLEPTRGQIDEDQLERLAALARAAGERGIHVIADFHQDIYARMFGGSGAPEWSIAPGDRLAEPLPPDRFWFLRYATSEEVRRSLTRFWTNADGIQDAFVATAGALAARLGREPAVIGIGPWNEPFPGERAFETFEAEDLAPFHRRVIGAARAHAPHWLAFVEGTVLASEQGTTLDLSDLPGVVYNPHFYDKVVTTGQSYGGDPREMNAAFATFVKDAARMKAPWLLGEYGVSHDTTGRVEYLAAHQAALLAAGVGGTAWHYHPDGIDDWNDERMALDDALQAVLAHPYPAAIHGEWGAAHLGEDFVVEWRSAGTAQPTEIVVPDAWAHRAIEATGSVTRGDRRIHVVAPEGSARVRIV